MEAVIEHWLVPVAREASLGGAEELSVPSDTGVAAAWDLVAMASGVDLSALARTVAGHYRLNVADLESVDAHAHRLLPGRVARKWGVVPLRYSDRYLWVATSDPVSLEAEKAIHEVAGRSVHFEIAPPGTLSLALDAMYEEEEDVHILPPLEPEARGGPRILVVDDDADTRLLLRSFLEDAGFRVGEAADGREALSAAVDTLDPYALITLDLNMPHVPGLEVLRTLREGTGTAVIPVVVATGVDDPAVEVELFEAGADDFVVKPVDPPRFLLRIKAVLRRTAITR